MNTQIENQDTFRQVLEEKLKTFLPKHFTEVEFSIIPNVRELNEPLALQISVGGDSFSINVYYLYEFYKKVGCIDVVLNAIHDGVQEAVSMPSQDDIDLSQVSKESVIPRIVFCLANPKLNRSFLKDHPHRTWNDLSIVYRIMVGKSSGSFSSFWITHQIAEQLDLQEDALYKLALVNTPRLLPKVTNSYDEILEKCVSEMKKMANEEGPDIIDFLSKCIKCNIFEDYPFWGNLNLIVSNDVGIDGASVMLYPDALSELANQCDSDFYLLPSSRHEILALETDSFSTERAHEFQMMVNEVNETSVKRNDLLSSSVYYYNRKTNEVTLACNGSLLEAGA